MTPIVLTIDPSGMGKKNEPAGWYLFDGKHHHDEVRPELVKGMTDEEIFAAWVDVVWNHFTYIGHNHAPIDEEVDWCNTVHFAVEDQYLGVNPQTMVGLVRNRTLWEAEAVRLGMILHPPIPYASWTWEVCGIRPGTRKEVAKTLYIQYAHVILEGQVPPEEMPLSEHVCAAVCMGQWLLRRLEEKRLLDAARGL